MKYIEKITLLCLLSVLIGLGFSACTVDEPIVVTPKTLDQYIAQYGSDIKAEILFVDSCKVSYKKGDFAVASTSSFANYKASYLAALKTDSAVIFKPGVTITEIIAANVKLNSTLVSGSTTVYVAKGFHSKLNIADLRALNDSITSATHLNNSVLTGTAAGNVLGSDKSVFSSAIALATVTRDLITTIDRQANEAIAKLIAAKAAFKEAIIPADAQLYLSNSTSYILSQLQVVKSSVAGYNINEYVPALLNNYLTALRSDSTLLATPGVSTSQIATAMNSLSTPRNAFVPNVADKRALNDSILAATSFNASVSVGTATGQVAQTAKTAFNTAITTATTARENPTIPYETTTGVKAQIYALTVAKQKFIAAIIK